MLHFCQKLKLLCYTLNPMIIQKVALAVFKDKKMLQVRTKKQDKVFYTLGGKIEKEDNDDISENSNKNFSSPTRLPGLI